MADIEYQLVKDKIQEWKPLFARMDTDEDLYFLKPYEMYMLPPNQKRKMPEVANVTVNDPLLYATKAIGIMGGAIMEPIVEGQNIPPTKQASIEQFLEDVFYMVDDRLNNRGKLGLDAWTNEQVNIRGGIVARVCLRMKDGKLFYDVLPIDRRSFVYECDDDGIAWGATPFRAAKSRIEQDYPGVKVEGKSAELVDYWDKRQNKIYIDGRPVQENENTYGYPPFVVAICTIGSMFDTDDAIEHQGEGIFWPNRGLWKEKSRTASILQTLNITTLFGGMQYESAAGAAAQKPGESPYGVRKVVPVEKGGGFKPLPISDIKNATRLFYSILEASLQKGSLAIVDYGTLTFPLSAIAITRLTASRDDVFLPRFNTKAVFRQGLSRMVIKQAIALNEPLELGEEGKENKYQRTDLEGEYSIKYRFYVESKEQRAADLSIASAAREFLSPETIRTEILNLRDPEGEGIKWRSHEAEKVDEVLFLYRRGRALLEGPRPSQEDMIQAYIIAERAETILEQRYQQAAAQVEGQRTPAPKAKPTGGGTLPLFPGTQGQAPGRGGAAGGPPQQPTEEGEMQEVSREQV